MARLLVGHNIWQLCQVPATKGSSTLLTITTGPHLVLSIKQFLPAGVVKPGFPKRENSLLDLICDDGRRVIAVADIWSRNPEKASDPW